MYWRIIHTVMMCLSEWCLRRSLSLTGKRGLFLVKKGYSSQCCSRVKFTRWAHVNIIDSIKVCISYALERFLDIFHHKLWHDWYCMHHSYYVDRLMINKIEYCENSCIVIVHTHYVRVKMVHLDFIKNIQLIYNCIKF